MLASAIAVKASASPKRSTAAVERPQRATLEDAQHPESGAGALAHRGAAARNGVGEELPGRRLEDVPVFSAGERGFESRPAIHAPGIVIQAKLCVGQTDDPLEHEANRVAADVMRAPASHLTIAQAPPHISRKTVLSSPAGAESRPSSAQDLGGVAPGIVHHVLRAPGQPMDAETRAFMEPRFGSDFGHIRIHADSTAARSAKEINARAYTAGNSIVFAEGQFGPHSAGGRSLLAHELAHTVQQGGQPQLIQRSPDKDDDDSAPSKPRDATVTQNTQGNNVIYRQQLNRGREHALLVRIIDFGTFPPRVQERLYRGQELPSLRGNKVEISWVDVTKEAQRNGPVSVDWNMPGLETGDKGKQQEEKDREIAEQHPNPVLSLLVPASNAYVKDRSSEIHDPLKRSQYQIDRQGIEAGTNLGRVTGAVAADTAAAASLAPAAAELVTAAAPEALYAGRYVYLNAPGIYASGVLYSGAAMTGAALAAHMQKIRSKGFDSSDIPQLAEDLMPAVGGYLEAQSFNTSAPNGKPSGAANPGAGTSGETAEAEFVITRPPQYDPQTKRISGTLAQPGSGETFDAEFDPVTGNGQIIERASRRVVGIIRNGEIKAPAAAALPAGQPDPSGPAASPVAPRPLDVRPPVRQLAAAPAPEPPPAPVHEPAAAPEPAVDPRTKSMKKPAHGGPRTAVHATPKTITSAKPQDPEVIQLPRSSRPHAPEYAADPNVPVKADVRENFTFDEFQRDGKTYKQARGKLGKAGEVVKHDDPAAKRSVSRGTGDDAGHLIARMYGGPSGPENLSRQNWISNEYGTFRNLEQYWETRQNKGFEVEVQVTDVTKAGADRPFLRNVQWTETAPDGTKIDNSLDFANTTTQESRQATGAQPTPSGPGGKVLPGPGSNPGTNQ